MMTCSGTGTTIVDEGPDDALAVTIVVLRLRGGVFGCVVESTQVPLEGD